MKDLIGTIFKYIIDLIIKRKSKKKFENIDYKEEIKKEEYLPYKINKNIFTDLERFFYKVLRDIVHKMDLNILTKVRLADIVYTYDENFNKYFNKIKSKHIDFVLIDKDGNIKLLIELDDTSHENYKRIERDKFLNKIFENQEIKLLRIPAKYSYNIKELENKIIESL